MPAPQYTNWVFTINNPNDSESPLEWPPQVSYCVWQLEEGDKGTRHWQGYLQLPQKKTLSYLKKNLNSRAHFEHRRGTHQEARAYCMKEGAIDGPWEIGTPIVCAGERTDLHSCMAMVKEGKPELDIADEFPITWARNYRALARYRMLSMGYRTYHTDGLVLYGKPGVGKTTFISSLLAENEWTVYWKPRNQWWDGYEGQEAVVFDEFFGWVPYELIKRLLDPTPLLVETKGGSISMVAKIVIFISNSHPSRWYDSQKMDLRALARRVSVFILKEIGGETERVLWSGDLVIEEL